MGMAAGIAAAVSVRCGVSPKDVDVKVLRDLLLERGAIMTMDQVNSLPVNV